MHTSVRACSLRVAVVRGCAGLRVVALDAARWYCRCAGRFATPRGPFCVLGNPLVPAGAYAVRRRRVLIPARQTGATDAFFEPHAAREAHPLAQRLKKVATSARSKTAAGRQGVKRAHARVTNAIAERRTARDSQRAATQQLPYLALVHSPHQPISTEPMGSALDVVTYNVHRWTGLNGRRKPDPSRAASVLAELDADVIALQEVLRPTDVACPLGEIAESLGMFLTFAATRQHRRGELGNAILSRFPLTAVSVIDISFSRLERRGALAVQFDSELGQMAIVATHLSLVDRTRARQVRSLLQHPQLRSGPAVLLGDMNAWRDCKATRQLDDRLEQHHNREWPASFPAARPVLALDRVYTHRAKVIALDVHDTPAARKASDHLPVLARIELPPVVGTARDRR